jgi:hypothetical protein
VVRLSLDVEKQLGITSFGIDRHRRNFLFNLRDVFVVKFRTEFSDIKVDLFLIYVETASLRFQRLGSFNLTSTLLSVFKHKRIFSLFVYEGIYSDHHIFDTSISRITFWLMGLVLKLIGLGNLKFNSQTFLFCFNWAWGHVTPEFIVVNRPHTFHIVNVLRYLLNFSVDIVKEHLDGVGVHLLHLHSLTACFQVEN